MEVSSSPKCCSDQIDQSKRKQGTSYLYLACAIVAVCIVTASWYPNHDGVSEASVVPSLDTGPGIGGNESFTGLTGPQLYRTAFHFQPPKNWMNDPCAPMYYKGWYHLFYQYNPWGAVWGNISWGHAVSKDLMNWIHLEPALIFDTEYDIGGVWSGSATIRESDGLPIILYTGVAENLTQTQNMAEPADPEDPFLVKWVKHPQNPLLHPPAGVGHTDFRDPSTAWKGPDGLWRITVGAQMEPQGAKTGMALVYKSSDLLNWELEENWLHMVNGTGIWECVDFFPVGSIGLDTSVRGPDVKHLLKVSSWDEQHDYYAVGSYDDLEHKFHTRDSPVIYGLQYDHGKFYAAKSFYDPVKSRRINWGWSSESDTPAMDVAKGWASVQAIPRVMTLDGERLIQAPIEELKRLRGDNASKSNIILTSGSVHKMNGSAGGQLDIEVTFDVPSSLENADVETVPFNCSSSGGAAHRGVFGPFGVLVMADDALLEQTAVFFYIAKSEEKWTTHFCSDQSRSTTMEHVERTVFQGTVEVLEHEKQITLRVLVDHSIIESFAQGGRTAITARVYPTEAVQSNAHVFLFNNGTSDIRVSKIDIWQMENTNAKTYLKTESLNEEDEKPVKLLAITEGIPQVDEPFLASHLASHHPASRPSSTHVPVRPSSPSLISPAVCSLLCNPATSSSPSECRSALSCSHTVVSTSV